MLFRHSGAPPNLLLVFLVGENPTSGIQKEALQESLICVDYALKQEICVDGEIRLLAPLYVGLRPQKNVR